MSPPSNLAQRVTLALLPVLCVLLGLAGALLLRLPPGPTPGTADAVVVLGGGSGHRVDRGLDLVRSGVARRLVLSADARHTAAARGVACSEHRPVEVFCIQPQPSTTAGEARMISRLAAARRWDHLIVVTTDFHARRAGVLFRQCLAGRVSLASVVPPHRIPSQLLTQAVQESAGLLWAVTGGRACSGTPSRTASLASGPVTDVPPDPHRRRARVVRPRHCAARAEGSTHT